MQNTRAAWDFGNDFVSAVAASGPLKKLPPVKQCSLSMDGHRLKFPHTKIPPTSMYSGYRPSLIVESPLDLHKKVNHYADLYESTLICKMHRLASLKGVRSLVAFGMRSFHRFRAQRHTELN